MWMLPRAVILALAVSAVIPGYTSAQEEQVVPEPLALSLAAWVSVATGLPMPHSLPDIRLAARKDMARLMHASESSSRPADNPDILAFYNTQTRTIVLPSDWTGATPAELSVLVHELVHHAQSEAGHRFACPAEREHQAYDAQSRWLGLFGTDLVEEFDLDRMYLLLATTCGMP